MSVFISQPASAAARIYLFDLHYQHLPCFAVKLLSLPHFSVAVFDHFYFNLSSNSIDFVKFHAVPSAFAQKLLTMDHKTPSHSRSLQTGLFEVWARLPL